MPGRLPGCEGDEVSMTPLRDVPPSGSSCAARARRGGLSVKPWRIKPRTWMAVLALVWSLLPSMAAATSEVTLTVSDITPTTVKLTLSGWIQAWSYKGTYVSCANVSAGTSEAVVNVQSSWHHFIEAFGAADCPVNGTRLDSVAFTRPRHKVTGVTVTAGSASLSVGWTAQGGANGYQVQWKSGSEDWSSSRQKNVTTNSATISSLVNGNQHTIRVRQYRSVLQGDIYGVWSDEATGTPVRPTLTASNVAADSATLTIENHAGAWYYKYTAPAGGQCSSEVSAGTSAANVTNLATGTMHTFKAYSDNGCATDTELATAADFLTRPGKVADVSVTGNSQSLAVSWTAQTGAVSYKVQWKSGTEDWAVDTRQTTSTTTSATISSLTGNTQYTLRVAATNATGDGAWSDEATGTPLAPPPVTLPATVTPPTLTASAMEATTTVTISDHAGDWWYSVSHDHAHCVQAIGTSVNLTGLTPGTTYTYTAYSDSACQTELTSQTFTTPYDPPTFGDQTIQNQTYAQDRAIPALTLPAATGGAPPLSYSLTPELPAGLTFDRATRTLAGTPAVPQGTTRYTYTVTESDGHQATVTFTLTAEADLLPTFGDQTIRNQTYTQDRAIPALTLPAATGGNPPLRYSLTPGLPAGLTFDRATRILAGTPTVPQEATSYTYTVTDQDGDQATVTFTLMVEADLPPTFGDQTIQNQTYAQDRAIPALTLPAATSGNPPLSYSLTPGLPAGLTFDRATRTLAGTPAASQGATSYTYTVTDQDGDQATVTFTLTVRAVAEKETLEAGLAAQGRALLSGATGVIGERFRNPGASSLAGVGECSGETPEPDEARDGSRPADCTTGLAVNTVAQAMLGLSVAGGRASDVDAAAPWRNGPRPSAGTAVDWESLVWGRSFAVPLTNARTDGSAWTLWGAGDIQGFQGDPGQGNYDGQVRSLYLGVDMQWQEQWLAGAALARSWGETDYEAGGSAGQVETTLTSIYPYVRGALGAGLEVWAMGGYGWGEAETTQAGATSAGDTRDLTMAMGATGARQPMTEVGGAQVALVGGAGYLSLATEVGDVLTADVDVAVQRARLAVEATWATGGLSPYVQVGGRYDGGDGQTGAGLETVAGLRYTSERLEFEARGRWLATHAAEGYEEYGGLGAAGGEAVGRWDGLSPERGPALGCGWRRRGARGRDSPVGWRGHAGHGRERHTAGDEPGAGAGKRTGVWVCGLGGTRGADPLWRVRLDRRTDAPIPARGPAGGGPVAQPEPGRLPQ